MGKNSDVDFLMSMGYEGLVRGEIPDWGDDDDFYNPENIAPKIYFKTFDEARIWSMNNGSKPFIRDPNGVGYIPKPTNK